jgi:hypothetical protein
VLYLRIGYLDNIAIMDPVERAENERKKRLKELKVIYNIYYPY